MKLKIGKNIDGTLRVFPGKTTAVYYQGFWHDDWNGCVTDQEDIRLMFGYLIPKINPGDMIEVDFELDWKMIATNGEWII